MPSIVAFRTEHFAIFWIEPFLWKLGEREQVMNVQLNARPATPALVTIGSPAVLTLVAS